MTSIALLIPALNEEAGIERTCRAAREALACGDVTSIYVLDGGSRDATREVARANGVDVLEVGTVRPDLGPVLGKGDSLFRGVHAVDADWYVFLDADLGNISRQHIAALTAPIGSPGVQFVKGGFVRVDEHGTPRAVPGGRVTEEFGRPLVRELCAPLAELSQPLSGQVAIESRLARSLPFVTGYGVEIAMLVDVWRAVGEPAGLSGGIVEADMGTVNNRYKPDDSLDDVICDVVSAAHLRGAMQFPDRVDTTAVVERRA